jgi:hypothetical protein
MDQIRRQLVELLSRLNNARLRIPSNVKHWHGAGPAGAMSHIAIAESLDGKPVARLVKVSDEQ